MEARTGVATVDRSTAAIADFATVPDVGRAIADELGTARPSHAGIRAGVAHPTRLETGTIVATVYSASATVAHLAAIARAGNWIAGRGRADIGAAHAHAVFAHPTRIDAGAVVTAGERVTTAVGDVATVGATGGSDGIGALIGGFAVGPAYAAVQGRIACPSGGTVVATIKLAVAAIANHAAIASP
jgi:hypothetical protein